MSRLVDAHNIPADKKPREPLDGWMDGCMWFFAGQSLDGGSNSSAHTVSATLVLKEENMTDCH